ncbi:hypothetical protein OAE97_00155 [Verrucomicrobia bacterium]|jgi:hypothetical protein|nr:hypothetical protein [Verrucomicrobiota bacterium]
MISNFQNVITSSFLMYIDHTVCKRGQATSDITSLFYPVTGVYKNYHTYAAPFKQIVSDASLPTPSQMTGVYVDGSFVVPGQNNLVAINHYDGQAIFSTDQSSSVISGDYAVKDYNVYLTDKPEDKILFYTKIENKSRITQTTRGLQVNEITFPAIFLSSSSTRNDPFSFGGTDMTNVSFRAIVMSDSQFSLDAACGILRDSNHSFFKLVDNSALNLNAMSAYTGTQFNYTGVATGDPVYIADVVSAKISRGMGQDYEDLNPDVFSAIVDFELEVVRSPHTDGIPL